jgi:tungstate transport system permease protein
VIAALAVAAVAAVAAAVPLVRLSFPGRTLLVASIRTSLFVPTIVLGLGAQQLLQASDVSRGWFTLTLLLGVLAWPLLVAVLIGVLRGADPRAWETALTLGASPVAAALAQLRDVRPALVGCLLAAAGRVTAETGCAALLWGYSPPSAPDTGCCGGNQALAVGIVLLGLALAANLIIACREGRVRT